MKNIFQNTWVKGAVLMASFAGIASFGKAQTVVCYGDSVCLDAGSFNGTIQWQDSPDGINFNDINGATTSPWCATPPPGDHYIRGVIMDGSCAPVYTDTLYAYGNPEIQISFVTNPILLTDCIGTLSAIGTQSGMNVSGGAGGFTFLWSGTGVSPVSAVDPDYTGQGSAGIQTLGLTVTDANGCTATSSLDVNIDPQGVTSFNFTGGIQTFTVPPCVDTIFVQAWGGQGGSGATGGNSASGGSGGLGGYAEGWLLVNPGDVINIFVGGQGATPTGGFNGGANGGSTNAGGGGGASDIRVGGTAEANRVLTAGGGGGGGRAGCETNTVAGGAGGSGGGGVGANGTDAPTSGGVAGGGKGGNFGGTQGLNGAAGTGCSGFLGSPGTSAATGTGGSGGAGQSCCCFTFGSIPGGGGGGGGQVGGGGGGGGSAGTTGCSGNDKGAGGGGGGGSSYTGGVLSGATNSGIWLGNGMVTISW